MSLCRRAGTLSYLCLLVCKPDQTTFKNVSVSTTAPPEDTTIYVDGGSVFITTEKDAPVGIMLSEEGVPASTYNLTLIPIDVHGAMIHVQTQLTQNMAIERDRHIAEKHEQGTSGASSVR